MRMTDQETRQKYTKLVPHATKDWSRTASAPDGANVAMTKNESSSAVPGWTSTHCVLSYTRKGSSPENAGSVKLIKMLKLDVAQMSVSRPNVLQCSDGSTTKGCDATYSLQARRRAKRRETANCNTHHTKKCGCDTEPTTLQIMLPSAPSPSKRQERCLHEWQRGRRAFLCGRKPVTEKKVQNDESERQTAQVLHAFCVKTTRTHFVSLLDGAMTRLLF